MTNSPWLRNFGHILQANSPAILTGISVAGVVGTAVLAVKATTKAVEVVAIEEGHAINSTGDGDYRCNPRRKVELTWRLYIPAALSGAATIACIIGAHQIGVRQRIALAGAYTLVDTTFREYKDRVLENITEQKATKIEDEVARRRLQQDPPPPDNQIFLAGPGEQLIRDSLSGRYFKSDIETIRRAVNDINQQILQGDMYVSQNEFYDILGLDHTTLGAEMGWNIDNLINPHFSTLLTDDGRACIVLGYQNLPKYDYHKL
jgi:uncharacterized protein DUF6353